jgi:hypothetical protein
MHYAQDSPQAGANLAAIESKLAELDHLFIQFCSQHDYEFSRSLNIFPKRRVWRRDDFDRCIDLEFGVSFQNALDHGFYPEFPWSLYARGSLHPGTKPGIRILSRAVLENVPHSQLSSTLVTTLARGLQILNAMTESEILAHGQTAQELSTQGRGDFEAYRRAQESARNAEPGSL